MTQKKFLRVKEAQEYTALARSTFYSYISKGLIPPPIKVGDRASAWPVSEIGIGGVFRSTRTGNVSGL